MFVLRNEDAVSFSLLHTLVPPVVHYLLQAQFYVHTHVHNDECKMLEICQPYFIAQSLRAFRAERAAMNFG